MSLFADHPVSAPRIFQSAASVYRMAFIKVWPCALAIGIVLMLGNRVNVQMLPFISFLLSLVMSVLLAYFVTIILYIYYGVALAENPSLSDAMDFALTKLMSVSLGIISYGLLVGIGLYFGVIPGLLLGFFLMLFLPLQLFLDFSVFVAFKSSFGLVWKHWWRSVWCLVTPFVALMALMMASGYFNLPIVLDYLISVVVAGLGVPFLLVLVLIYTNDLIARAKQRDALKEFKEFQKSQG